MGALTLEVGRFTVPGTRAGNRRRRARARNGIEPGRAVVAQDTTAVASETDAELVERVRSGDPRAFERLVRRHLGVAHMVARSKLSGDSDDADDVCQEAFIAALERIDDCRDPARFRSWLLTIVRNKAHNRREYLAVRDAAPLDAVGPMASSADTSARVERRELREELATAMEGLTDLQRRVFVRFDMEGWDHGEIAEEMGISRGASRVHLHAARRALRKRLSTHPMAWSR